MFFGFQLTCGLMMVFYGYSVMKNPRVWGDQGRRAVKPEHFEEYGRQNGLFFLKAGCVMAVIGALDALVTLDALLYLLLYVFGRGPTSRARKSASRSCARSRNSRRKSKPEPRRAARVPHAGGLFFAPFSERGGLSGKVRLSERSNVEKTTSPAWQNSARLARLELCQQGATLPSWKTSKIKRR